jgi:cholesterol transport system auxiliary component
MNRRWLLQLAAALAASGCSVLPAVPYTQRRDWPILVPPPDPLSPRAGAPVLLVRSVVAAPGLDRRGLIALQPDGSLHVDFYEQWAVPQAEGVGAALQAWLAASGLYAAVIASGSGLTPDLSLEAGLTRFWADPGAGTAEASLALVLLDRRRGATRVRLQRTVSGQARLEGKDAPAFAHGMLAALADTFAQATQALGAVS